MNSQLTRKNTVRLDVSLLVLIPLILAYSLTSCSNQGTSDLISVGMVSDFPQDSVTYLEVSGVFVDPDPPATIIVGDDNRAQGITQANVANISPIPILLVHTQQGEFLAIYAREPHLGCRIEWDEPQAQLVSPCFGERYTLTGVCLYGPCERDLDMFTVVISAKSEVMINLQDFQMGANISH
jgi:Rieske Fe-S protein